MSQVLDRVLTAARQLGASDVHLKAGLPPIFRIKGDLRTVRDVPALTREAIAQFAVHMMNDRQRGRLRGAPRHRTSRTARPTACATASTCSSSAAPLAWCCVSSHPRCRRSTGSTSRRRCSTWTSHHRGVVLVTGATGSGKSTTLAAMIDYVNSTYAYHIVTVEDPIEYTFRDKRSVINQREIGFDTLTFSRALRAALRQDSRRDPRRRRCATSRPRRSR